MTADELITILRDSGADAWEITDTSTEGWEFYFIRNRLDQNRVRDVEHIKVRLFKTLDDGRKMGSATSEIDPMSTSAEAKQRIEKLLRDAAYVTNPFFTLNTPSPVSANMQETMLSDIAKEYLETVKAIPETDTEDINSYEIFVEKCRSRFINSEGIDVTQTYPLSMLEIVVNARNIEKEIELYRLFTAGTCERSALTRNITELMKFGKDRLTASPTPPLEKAPVIFSTQDAVEIYKWFAFRVSASYKYMKLTDWETGTDPSPESTGDRVSLTARAFIEGSSKNRSIDDEGAPTSDLVLIDKGIPVRYWGSRQFRSYLGVDDGYIAQNFEVSGGTGTDEGLREGSYMEIVEFSDFTVDDITGDIAGEIRLGYWHDKGTVTAVSGGSVSGSLREFMKDMRFSAALRRYDNYVIPELTRLEGVHITGIERE